jgi:hypothetical protein
MSDLLMHLEIQNKEFVNKIIAIVKDDKKWLTKIGISKSEAENKKSVPNLIEQQISIPANRKSIDLLLRFLISEYLIDDDKIPLIKHVVSAESYTRKSALFVFKCAQLYFCYFYYDSIESQITEDPEAFCWETAATILENYEIETENLSDEWFADSDTYNELNFNFNFNES